MMISLLNSAGQLVVWASTPLGVGIHIWEEVCGCVMSPGKLWLASSCESCSPVPEAGLPCAHVVAPY